MRLVNAICELGFHSPNRSDGMTLRSLEPHVIVLRTYIRFDPPRIPAQHAHGVSLFHHDSHADDLMLIA